MVVFVLLTDSVSLKIYIKRVNLLKFFSSQVFLPHTAVTLQYHEDFKPLAIPFLYRPRCLHVHNFSCISKEIFKIDIQVSSNINLQTTKSPPTCFPILSIWMLSFKPTFSLPSFTFIKRLFRSSSLSAIRVVSSAYLRLLIFLPAILIPACAYSNPAFYFFYVFVNWF